MSTSVHAEKKNDECLICKLRQNEIETTECISLIIQLRILDRGGGGT